MEKYCFAYIFCNFLNVTVSEKSSMRKENMVRMQISKHFQKIIKNISKSFFGKFFLQLLLVLF